VVFDHNLDAAPAGQPIWPWLTLAAALLLPLDIAARRLQLTRRDWGRVWSRLTADRPRPTAAPERAEGMSALLEAKGRAAVGRFGKSPPPTTSAESASSDAAGEQPVMPSQPPPAESRPPTTGAATPATDAQQPAAAEESLAARLRRRREG